MKLQLPLLFVFALCLGQINTAEAGAKYLHCGQSYWYGAPTESHYNKSNYHSQSCVSYNYDFKGADQTFYFDVDEYSDVTIEMSGFHEDMDMLLFKEFDPWGYGSKFSDCKGASLNYGNTAEKIKLENAHGRYYLVVEAYKWGWASGYDLKITCTPRPQAKSCHDYPVIRCGDWKQFNYNYEHSKVTSIVDHHTCHSSGYGGGYGSSHGTDYSGPEMIYRIDNSWGQLNHASIDFHALDHNYEYEIFVYKWCKSYWDDWSHSWKTEFSGLVNSCHSGHGAYDHSIYVDHVGYGEDLYVVIESKSHGWGSYGHGFGNFKLAVSCGDICDQYMEPVQCGDYMTGTTTGYSNHASYYWQNNSNYSGHNWGPERTYKFKVDHYADYEIKMKNKGYADLNMYLMDDCHAKKCMASSTTRGKGYDEHIKYRLYPGTYYIVIEGYHGDHGKYDLEITGCDCHYVEELWCDSPRSGSNAGAHDDISVLEETCFTSGVWLKGPDKTYLFKAPKNGYYEFNLTNLRKDLDLFLISKCNKDAVCLGFSTKVGDNDESIRIHLDKHEKIYAHVDSKSAHVVSSYKIKVVCDPDPEPEPDPDPYPDPEPDPDPDPYPDPEPDPSCAAFSSVGGAIQIDLTEADLTFCEDAEVSVTVAPLNSDGDAIDSLEVSIAIDGDVLTYDVGLNEDGTDYQVCYTEVCGDETQSCCKTIYFEGTLSCGITVSGTTIGKDSDFASLDIEDCYSSSSSFVGPDALIHFVKSSDDDVLQLTMFQETANLSVFVLDEDKNPVGTGCKGDNFNATKDLVNGGALGEYWTDAADPLPAGNYYALIDGFSGYVASDFTLNIACGLDCGSAESIACGASVEGSTVGGINNQSAYHIEESLKVGYTGSEDIYALILDSSAEVTITLSDISGEGGADLDLFVLSGDCDANTVMGQSISPEDTDESITMTLAAGSYYIVVDGWDGSGATYKLSVEGCTDSSDNIQGNLATKRSGDKLSKEIISHAVYPNPFSTQLQIEINVDADTDAKLAISAIDGKLIMNRNIGLTSGSNIITVTSDEMGIGSGLMYYQIITETQSLQGKVIRID